VLSLAGLALLTFAAHAVSVNATTLTTSLIASRLSTKAKQRALDAIERQQHIEQLCSFREYGG
jgi:hypothetical protein